jgi:hypothetical protein
MIFVDHPNQLFHALVIVYCIPYHLKPTHNKQSFADEKEYHFLLKIMGEYMRQYWTDTGIEHYVKEFWEAYGEIQ